MRNFRTLLAKELFEQWRTLRMLGIAAVFLLVGVGSPLFARYTNDLLQAAGVAGFVTNLPRPTAADSVAQLVKNLTQLALFMTILVAMAGMARERERGTAALVLSKPVGRTSFVAAKLVALALTLGAGTVAAGLVAAMYTQVLFGTVPVGSFVAATLLGLLALLVFAALCFAIGTITGSSLLAAVVGFAVLVVMGLLSLSPAIAPWTAVGMAGEAVKVGGGSPVILGPALLNAGIAGVCAMAAALRFRRQEV